MEHFPIDPAVPLLALAAGGLIALIFFVVGIVSDAVDADDDEKADDGRKRETRSALERK